MHLFIAPVVTTSFHAEDSVRRASSKTAHNRAYKEPVTGQEVRYRLSVHRVWFIVSNVSVHPRTVGKAVSGGGFFIACEELGRMFDHSFPCC